MNGIFSLSVPYISLCCQYTASQWSSWCMCSVYACSSSRKVEDSCSNNSPFTFLLSWISEYFRELDMINTCFPAWVEHSKGQNWQRRASVYIGKFRWINLIHSSLSKSPLSFRLASSISYVFNASSRCPLLSLRSSLLLLLFRCQPVMLVDIPNQISEMRSWICANWNLRRLPWITYPLISDFSCGQVSPVVQHFRWQLALLRFILVL
jgi:hypothetical protein